MIVSESQESYSAISVACKTEAIGIVFIKIHKLVFHLGVLESVYIKTQNPILCRQKEFVFSLKLFN